jgi:hypothetical protein
LEEILMRRVILAILIALAPSIAFAAHGGHGGHGGGGHGGFHGGGFHGGFAHRGFRHFGGVGFYPYYASNCWRYVRTLYGPRRVWVCSGYGYY